MFEGLSSLTKVAPPSTSVDGPGTRSRPQDVNGKGPEDKVGVTHRDLAKPTKKVLNQVIFVFPCHTENLHVLVDVVEGSTCLR